MDTKLYGSLRELKQQMKMGRTCGSDVFFNISYVES